MIATPKFDYITPDKYLAMEEQSEIKHEYCNLRDAQTQNHKRFPKLIIEVLSKSTEGFEALSETLRERGDKFADYQQLETLEEYVLVNTKRQRLDCFRKEGGRWFVETYSGEQESFQLSSINFEGKFVDLYEDVTF